MLGVLKVNPIVNKRSKNLLMLVLFFVLDLFLKLILIVQVLVNWFYMEEVNRISH
jgi:hypothetical protein